MVINGYAERDLRAIWIEPDLSVVPRATIKVRDEADLDVDVTLTVELDVEAKRYVGAEVLVEKRYPGPEVTGERLRDLRLQEYLRTGLRGLVGVVAHGGQVLAHETDLMTNDALIPRSSDRPTLDSLRWVARIYRVAALRSEPRAKSVADRLSLTQRTATRWIARAREEKLLT